MSTEKACRTRSNKTRRFVCVAQLDEGISYLILTLPFEVAVQSASVCSLLVKRLECQTIFLGVSLELRVMADSHSHPVENEMEFQNSLY